MTLLAATLVVLAGNWIFAHVDTNRGYWLLEHKWSILKRTSAHPEWLFLGDSSCNQGISPKRLMERGRSALNLCTIGDALVINDAWMAEEWFEKHPAPRAIAVVHTAEVWSRNSTTLRQRLLAHLPQGIWSREPRIAVSTADRFRARLAKGFPLWFNAPSIRGWLGSLGQLRFETDDLGFMPVRDRDSEFVAGDVARTLEYFEQNRPVISEENERALRTLAAACTRRGVMLYLLPAPTAARVAESAAFRRFHVELSGELQRILSGYAGVFVRYETVASYPETRLENADHLLAQAADDYTDWVWERVEMKP